MSSVRVAFSLCYFVAFLLLGWQLGRRGVLTQPRASRLMRGVIRFVAPPMLCLALWAVRLESWRMWLLPVLGVVICLSMLGPAWLYARRVGFSPPRTGSLLICACFSNLGFLGAFTAFALFGEEAFGLCLMYMLFFEPCIYTLGFSIAGHYGRRADRDASRPELGDGLRWYPIAGMALGVILNLLHVPRPEALGAVNQVLIPVDMALYLTAVGTQLTFRLSRRWIPPSVAISLIKFVYAPAVAWLLVTAVGLEGLPRFVVLLEASMPVAVTALMFPLLFDLDRELSNALWLSSTAFAVPWLLLVIPLLQRL